MQPWAVLFLIFAAALELAALSIYRGNTGWIKSFRRAKMTDRKKYARFLGRTIAFVGLAIAVGALTSLFFPAWIAVIVLCAGTAVVIVLAAKKAGKYV